MNNEIHELFISDLGTIMKPCLSDEELFLFVSITLTMGNSNNLDDEVAFKRERIFEYKCLLDKIANYVCNSEKQYLNQITELSTCVENLKHKISFLEGREKRSYPDRYLRESPLTLFKSNSIEFRAFINESNIKNIGQILKLTKTDFVTKYNPPELVLFEIEKSLERLGLDFVKES